MSATKQSRVRLLSILSSVLLMLLLVTVNVVFARSTVRMDLTEEKIYTLSEGARSILAKLKDPTTVTVFWHNVPSKSEPTRRYLEGLLDEMGESSDDTLSVVWADMSGDEGVQTAQRLGVNEFVFGSVEGDEVIQSKGYMSLVVEMGSEKPFMIDRLTDNRDRLEYMLVAELHRRSRLSTPVIGLVQGAAGLQMGKKPPSRFRVLEANLKNVFGEAVRPDVDLTQPVPDQVDVLIVLAPKDWSEIKAYNLEQFVLRGGRLLLLLDPVDFQSIFATGATGQPRRSGLEDWLGHMGVTVDTGVVGDFKAHGMFLSRGLVAYPYWPKVTSENADQTNPIARSFSATLMRWPSGFSVDQAKQTKAGRSVKVLASTTESGYRRPDLMGLKDGAMESEDGKILERIPVVLLLEGPITSYWNERPLPQAPQAIPPGGMPPGMPGFGPPGGFGPDEDGGSSDDDAQGSPDGDAPGSPDGDAAGSPDGDASGSPDGAAPKPDAPKPDAPKPDAPKPDAPKPDAPKPDAPKPDAPKPDTPKPDAPATDGAGGPAGEDDGEDAPAGDDDDGSEDDGSEDDGGVAPAPDEPPATDGDAPDPDAPAPEPDAGPAQEDRSSHVPTGTGRIVLLGDAGLVSDMWVPMRGVQQEIMILAQFNGRAGAAGFNFVQNSADWLSGSDELLTLRSRNDNPRTLEKKNKDEQKFIQWLNILLVPLLVLIAGLVVFIVRRR